jgi:type IV secretion system protein VirB10
MGRAQGEMPLPPLRIESRPEAPAATDTGSTPTAPAAAAEAPIALAEAAPAPSLAARPPGGNAAPVAPASAGLAGDRRLAGAVLARRSDSEVSHAAAAPPPEPVVTVPGPVEADTVGAALPRSAGRGAEPGGQGLPSLLHAAVTPAVPARVLPTQRFLLPQGSFIDCTLETAIDSTLPGMTTCVTATDTFGADGRVVLLERGTKLVGETRGQVQQGQARVFVLWTQARTPAGVVVPLASPGTDELGRSGLSGEVQRHFWQRFGAATLISLIDGAVQAGIQASARTNGGAFIYAPSASQDVLTEVLRDTAGIAPTVVKRNGDRIQVLVARDLDFRPVYELRVSTGH